MRRPYSFVLNLFLIMILGGAGAVILDRAALPYLSTLPVFRNLPLVSRQTPIVINRREEIRISEGVNNAEIVNRAGSVMAPIWVHEGTFPSEKFRLAGSATGVVVGSDGLLMTPSAALRPGLQTSIVLGGSAKAAKVLASDPLTGFAFLKIDQKDLPVVRQGFSKEVEVGEKLLALSLGDSPAAIQAKPVTATGKSLPVAGLSRVYDFASLNAFLPVGEPLPLGALLFNRDAALVGMVAQIGKDQVVVRAEDLKLALDKFFAEGRVSWPNLRASYRVFGKFEAGLYGFAKEGVLIKTAEAPLREKDFVYAVEGREISPSEGFQEILLGKKPGERAKLKIIRDGQDMEAEITL